MSNKSLKFIKSQLSEHFDNFVVVAIDREGNLIWDYNNWMVAVMLMERSKDLLEDDADGLELDDEDDDGGWEEDSILKI
tara:strand:- start:342 stop:578 length:237 start_codon:yes stop_codon:yes gene_type:complete